MENYNLIVIGAGPAGQHAAKKAAFFGRKVAVVDAMKGSLSTPRRMRKLMFKIYGLQDAGMLECLLQNREDSDEASQAAKNRLKDQVFAIFKDDQHPVGEESEVVHSQLRMHNLTVYEGTAQFLNMDEIQITDDLGKKKVIEGANIIIATGAGFVRPEFVPFDGVRIYDPKTIFDIETIPESITVVGAGVNMCQFCITFALMGASVKWVLSHKELFADLDDELRQQAIDRLKFLGIEVFLDARVENVEKGGGDSDPIIIELEKGEALSSDVLLYGDQKSGRADRLDCDEAGIECDYYGSIMVNEQFQTNVGHIYAIGDVVKSPIMESERKHQGITAAKNIFGFEDTESLSDHYPVGYFLLPQMAYFGYTESEAKRLQMKYVIGRTDYSGIPYGRIANVQNGFMKLIVNKETEELVGVHVFGRNASDLVHFGMELVEDRIRIGKIIGSVFNGSTLHELYHYAAMDAWYKLKNA